MIKGWGTLVKPGVDRGEGMDVREELVVDLDRIGEEGVAQTEVEGEL